MTCPIKFFSDRVVHELAYPAFASWSALPRTNEWRQFGQHWPFTVPADLHEYCALHDVPYELDSHTGYWTVALKFFDFGIDYFALLDPKVKQKILDKKICILFYYDEGDHPGLIKQRLDQLCHAHNLPGDSYKFVSANSRADDYKNFVFFVGDELLYWARNRHIAPLPIHTDFRNKQFTALSRTDKPWRATIMTDLVRNGFLDNSYWSYHTENSLQESIYNNPIEAWRFDTLLDDVKQFLLDAPYSCDGTTSDQQNDHSRLQPEHYNDSYCSIILETHFDVDKSNGCFLTEKTFKAIKHGQPFVIAGAQGSLSLLRQLGYRTFDHAIDNSYDLEPNPTERYKKLKQVIADLHKQDLHRWFLSCLDDVEHNQKLFCSTKQPRLNMLFKKLSNK